MDQREARAAAVKARHRLLLRFERRLWRSKRVVAGLDEAGAGPLAGPVVAACVVLDPRGARRLVGVDDSKALTATRREELETRIQAEARAWSVDLASLDEIEAYNIRGAGLLAMRRALEGVVQQGVVPDHLLVDARQVPDTEIEQTSIIGGDAVSLSIGAASILAKVVRDRWMVEAAERFPGYGFETHKGYGTAQHLRALRALGPCAIHRRTFGPVAALDQMSLFD